MDAVPEGIDPMIHQMFLQFNFGRLPLQLDNKRDISWFQEFLSENIEICTKVFLDEAKRVQLVGFVGQEAVNFMGLYIDKIIAASKKLYCLMEAVKEVIPIIINENTSYEYFKSIIDDAKRNVDDVVQATRCQLSEKSEDGDTEKLSPKDQAKKLEKWFNIRETLDGLSNIVENINIDFCHNIGAIYHIGIKALQILYHSNLESVCKGEQRNEYQNDEADLKHKVPAKKVANYEAEIVKIVKKALEEKGLGHIKNAFKLAYDNNIDPDTMLKGRIKFADDLETSPLLYLQSCDHGFYKHEIMEQKKIWEIEMGVLIHNQKELWSIAKKFKNGLTDNDKIKIVEIFTEALTNDVVGDVSAAFKIAKNRGVELDDMLVIKMNFANGLISPLDYIKRGSGFENLDSVVAQMEKWGNGSSAKKPLLLECDKTFTELSVDLAYKELGILGDDASGNDCVITTIVGSAMQDSGEAAAAGYAMFLGQDSYYDG